MSGTILQDPEVRRLVELFNEHTIKDYQKLHKEENRFYTDEEKQNIIETHRGVISPGAIYKWPAGDGQKVHVNGFGLIELDGVLWFLAAFNSKRLGRPKIEKLYPKEVLKMLEYGEIEYIGNILNPEFRRTFDYERLSLAVIGFASLVMTMRLQKNVSIEEVMHKLETGEMTMDDLLKKCGDVESPEMV